MRATIARSAIVVATICSFAGCQSPSVHPFWNRFTFQKNKSDSTAIASGQTPQLPSASASATTPYSTPGTGSASGTTTGTYPNTSASYQTTRTDSTNPYSSAASYGPYSTPGATAAPTTSTATPQTGPYTSVYGQASQNTPTTNNSYTAADNANAYSTAATTPNANSYQTTTTSPASYDPRGGYGATADAGYSAQGAPADNNYRTADRGVASTNQYGQGTATSGASTETNSYGTTNDYRNARASEPEMSDNRYANRSSDTPKYEQPQAKVEVFNTPATTPTANGSAYVASQPPASGYDSTNAGNTAPGTGYTPPAYNGGYQYQNTAAASGNVRKDPFYRPGGTSDYGTSGTRTASNAAPPGYPARPSGAYESTPTGDNNTAQPSGYSGGGVNANYGTAPNGAYVQPSASYPQPPAGGGYPQTGAPAGYYGPPPTGYNTNASNPPSGY